MKNLTKIMFMFMMVMSTVIVISSNNWLSMWMGLEMNLLSFIPLMFNKKKKSESMMMYFMIQSMASIILLISILWNNLLMVSNLLSQNLMNNIMIISLIMKMGGAPFHFWLPEVIMVLNWNSCFILMTWQKIAPIFMLSKLKMSSLLIIFIISSAYIGAVGGLNQNSIKKILAFSSINHLSWIMASIYMDSKIWIKYLLIYAMMLSLIIFMLNMYNLNYISQTNITPTSTLFKINLTLMIMSLGGLPPLLGFIPKLMIIQSMIMKNNLIILLMIMLSMITLFYYMKIMTNMIMNFYMTNKWMLKTMKQEKYQFMIMSMNLLLPFMSFLLM
uniref:NADH-ubiquinone oxidoreductase chain 2 n=1 Tax=Helotrephes semiglobosus semiglobosus TaxID=1481668 RepID=A0A059TC32_9HEMI|nr:NADH dehydrogenase subunit 2 [Helotrephes semiglobosus semiglobosus]